MALSFLYWKILSHYNKLTKGTKKEDLSLILDKILERQNLNRNEIVKIEGEVKKLIQEGATHIQKAGVVRFNPFSDTGGDSSFSLALLDGNLNGIVITGLHTRERTRVYLKAVSKGKSRYELSNEEEKAVADAIKH